MFLKPQFSYFFLIANGCQVDMIPQERIASSRLENYHAVLVSNLVILKNLFKKTNKKRAWNMNFSLNDFMLLKISFPNVLVTH